MNHSEDEARTCSNTNANDNNPLVTFPTNLLCSIFSMNAEVFKHSPGDRNTLIRGNDPLLDLRNSSQVCSTWRCIILASPVLWARSISLDHLLHWKPSLHDVPGEEMDGYEELDEWDALWTRQDPARYLWMNEVLRRTEKAPLWVKATEIYYKASVSATLGLLQSEWDRIERLSIQSIPEYSFVSDFENILTRPAPVLREFQLHVYSDDNLADLKPIFSNNAPYLLNLIASNFRIDSRANWLSNLRVLRINIRRKSDFPQLADVLPQVPLLNTLSINGSIDPTEYNQFKQDVFQPVDAFVKRLVQIKQPNRIGLAISHTSSTIELTTPGKQRPDFLFEFSDSNANTRTLESFDQVDALMESLINILLFPEICCVTEFELYQRARVEPVLFGSVFAHFSNVGTLITDERSLLMFFDADASAQPPGSSPHVVFPLLHTIRLHTLSISSFSGPKKLKNVLKRLRDEGKPFNVLDITECAPGHYPVFDITECAPGHYPVLDILETLTGMKLLWVDPGVTGTQEYICGSRQHAKAVFMTPPRRRNRQENQGTDVGLNSLINFNSESLLLTNNCTASP